MENFKKELLDVVFKHFDKFYLHAFPSNGLSIGKRGLIGDEKEQGIILVFGQQSYKNFEYDEENIYVSMRFSGKWENLIIPYGSIVSIFDDPVNAEMVLRFKPSKEISKQESQDTTVKTEKKKILTLIKEKKENVVKVNFNKDNEEN